MAIPAAFLSPWIAGGIYVLVALIWLVPDRRIEHVLKKPGNLTIQSTGLPTAAGDYGHSTDKSPDSWRDLV
jgi:hypothetical protein